MKLWLGKEQEGDYKGLDTLFIGSPDVSYKEIKEAIKENDFNQIYFGAGRCSKINVDVIKKSIKYKYTFKHNFIITAEIDINKLHLYDINMLKKINLIVTFNHKNITILNKIKNEAIVQIKLQNLNNGGDLIIGSIDQFNEVDTKNIKGKTYKGDIVIK